MTRNPVALVLLLGGLVVGGVQLWNHVRLWYTARGIRKPPKSYEVLRQLKEQETTWPTR